MAEFGRKRAVAAEEMYRRFAPDVYGIGLRMFHDPELAATLVEDTFVTLWRRGPRFLSGSASLDDWVRAHAVAVGLKMLRHAVDRRGTQFGKEVRADAATIRA